MYELFQNVTYTYMRLSYFHVAQHEMYYAFKKEINWWQIYLSFQF